MQSRWCRGQYVTIKLDDETSDELIMYLNIKYSVYCVYLAVTDAYGCSSVHHYVYLSFVF